MGDEKQRTGPCPIGAQGPGRALEAGSNREKRFVPPTWTAGGCTSAKSRPGRAGSDRWMETMDTRGLGSKLGPRWLDPNSVVELTRLAWM